MYATIWNTALSGVNATTNQVTYSVDNADGDYTAGLAAAFGSIPTLYSIATGNWSSTISGQQQAAVLRAQRHLLLRRLCMFAMVLQLQRQRQHLRAV